MKEINQTSTKTAVSIVYAFYPLNLYIQCITKHLVLERNFFLQLGSWMELFLNVAETKGTYTRSNKLKWYLLHLIKKHHRNHNPTIAVKYIIFRIHLTNTLIYKNIINRLGWYLNIYSLNINANMTCTYIDYRPTVDKTEWAGNL